TPRDRGTGDPGPVLAQGRGAGGGGCGGHFWTSAICTGRCCCRERVAASAIHVTASASLTVQGLGRRPATTSVKAVSSATNASASRSMKNVQGFPVGQLEPDSRLRSGVLSDQPAATESAVPCSSSRTSCPLGLYRVLDTTAVAPSSKVSRVWAVATSPSSAKKASPRA